MRQAPTGVSSAVDLTVAGPSLRALHAGTDHSFWGVRPLMRLACLGTFPAISAYVHGARPDPLTRELFVGALLGTMLSAPSKLWDLKVGQPGWKHYNKAGTLPYFDAGRGSAPVPGGGYQRVVDNLRAARASGMDRVDPLASPPFVVRGQPVVLLKGPHANPHDFDWRRFVTEKDFLGLLVGSNVTVCDLGAGTAEVRYKGVVVPRPSLPCRALPAVRRAPGTAAAAAAAASSPPPFPLAPPLASHRDQLGPRKPAGGGAASALPRDDFSDAFIDAGETAGATSEATPEATGGLAVGSAEDEGGDGSMFQLDPPASPPASP
jgi:hypothetical protein